MLEGPRTCERALKQFSANGTVVIAGDMSCTNFDPVQRPFSRARVLVLHDAQYTTHNAFPSRTRGLNLLVLPKDSY